MPLILDILTLCICHKSYCDIPQHTIYYYMYIFCNIAHKSALAKRIQRRDQLIDSEALWPTFCRRHFVEWNVLRFYSDFIEICLWGFKSILFQVITQTSNYYLNHWQSSITHIWVTPPQCLKHCGLNYVENSKLVVKLLRAEQFLRKHRHMFVFHTSNSPAVQIFLHGRQGSGNRFN